MGRVVALPREREREVEVMVMRKRVRKRGMELDMWAHVNSWAKII